MKNAIVTIIERRRDTFRMGGAANLDSAPFFVAQLTIENHSVHGAVHGDDAYVPDV
jgi:hypothetical protein